MVIGGEWFPEGGVSVSGQGWVFQYIGGGANARSVEASRLKSAEASRLKSADASEL